MNSRPLDTTESAWEKVREIYLRLGPEGRVEAAFAASELIREATLAGLRLRHPAWDERRLHAALLDALKDGFDVSAEEASEALRLRGMFNAIDLESGWKADIIVCPERDFERNEIARRTPRGAGDEDARDLPVDRRT